MRIVFSRSQGRCSRRRLQLFRNVIQFEMNKKQFPLTKICLDETLGKIRLWKRVTIPLLIHNGLKQVDDYSLRSLRLRSRVRIPPGTWVHISVFCIVMATVLSSIQGIVSNIRKAYNF
jgi:hypothetical protein